MAARSSALKSVGIALALAAGYAVVLGGPAFLLWDALRPDPWNGKTIQVRFQSVRFEAGGLVFSYKIHNRTSRTLRVLPESAAFRMLQPAGAPSAGFAHVYLPLDLNARSSRVVDVRLELSSGMFRPAPLATVPPEKIFGDPPRIGSGAPVSPLPMKGGMETPEADSGDRRDPFLPIDLIQGFELLDQSTGVRIVFPRGW